MGRHWAVSGLRPVLTGALSKVIEFPSPMNGRLTNVMLRIGAVNTNGDAVFDVNINDVSVYASPTDRAKIVSGATTGTSVIDKEIFLNDMITVDLDAAPLGGISALYVIVQIDDSPTVIQYISNVYQQALRRAPTTPELNAAVTALNAGCATGYNSLSASETFLDSIFTSSEYTTSFGLTDANFVEDLYQAILARPSDPGGKAFHLNEIALGQTRLLIISHFNYSVEHVNQRVVGWCPNVLPLTDAIRIRGKDVSAVAPTANQVWQFDGTSWVPVTLTIISDAFDFKASARAATTTTLPAYTSTAGVITATSNGALPAQDGVTLIATNRLMVKDEVGGNQKYNGLYAVTQVGDGSHPFILTRTSDANTSAKVTANMLVPIAEGTTLKDTQWWLTTNDPIVLDTDALTFSQFGKPSDPNVSYLWQSETPAQAGIHRRFYVERGGVINGVRPQVSNGDGTVTAQFDFLKNGVSIYPTSTKPNVPASSFVNGSFLPDTISFSDGDYFQINIINTGNTIGPVRMAIIFKGA